MIAGILIPLAILAFLVVLIAMGVFIAIRVRGGESIGVSFRTIFIAYVYIMSIASILVFTGGLSVGLKALTSDVFGRDFSYFVSMPRPPVAPGERDVPSIEEQQKRSGQEAERSYKNDLIQGGSLVVVGAILWGLHLPPRRGSVRDAMGGFFSKAYSAILLVIFGIAGVISLASGVYETLQYVLLEANEFGQRSRPGESLSAALVFVPTWIYYLMSVMKRSQVEEPAQGEQEAGDDHPN